MTRADIRNWTTALASFWGGQNWGGDLQQKTDEEQDGAILMT